MSLSLSYTCQRDKVSLIIKFGLNKNNFIKKNDYDVARFGGINKKLKALVYILLKHIYFFLSQMVM